MYIIVFGFFIIKLQISVSEPQFPPHIDLQKVGEAIFNNEKFNILKPTTHRVTDHFKDFMLRTESSYLPEKRIFIDKNGFRHDWFGFGEKTKSLRKTDLKYVSGSFENASENSPESNINSTDNNENTTAPVDDTNISDNNVTSNENENNNQEVENNASDNNDTVQNFTEEDTKSRESKETTTIINLFPAIRKTNSSTKITIEERLRQGEANSAAKPAPAKKVDTEKKAKSMKNMKTTEKKDDYKKKGPASKEDDKKKKDKMTDSGDKAKTEDKPKSKGKKSIAKKERTVATTTFFCPYFGTITMSSFID